jgi:hypothetical protein
VSDEEVDKLLQGASRSAGQVEPALLKRISNSINASLQPVRPLPPTWVLTGGLVLICATVAGAAAAHAGFYGIAKLTLWERVLIFSTLGILMWAGAQELVGQIIPGSRQRVSAAAFVTVGSAALLGVFGLLFRDYRTDHFVYAGVECLLTGLLIAIPAALLSWLLLRRGFAVNSVTAGLVGGSLAGLSGVAMLELHCANFQALHILVWHTAVVPTSAAAGALLGWLQYRRSRRPPRASTEDTP